METAKGKTREETINRLADRIDNFERYKQPHSRLMAELATRLGSRFGLTRPDIDAIGEAAMLHDIGLFAMEPAPGYLSLPRALSFEARLDLWRHPVIGEQQMSKREAGRHAQLLVRWHHEWWNGSGYPDKLAFEDIPIGARILRAVELYAALICDRPYRAALDERQAVEMLTASAGMECDPYVVKALLALLDELHAVQEQPSFDIAQPPVSTTQSSPTADPSFEPPPVQSWLVPAPPSTDPTFAVPTPGSEVHAALAPDDYQHADQSLQAPTAQTAEQVTGITESALPQASTAGALSVEQPAVREPSLSPQPAHLLLSHAQKSEAADKDSPNWRGWRAPSYNRKSLLGFQASVLRQLEFRSIAIPFWSEQRLDLYLKAWAKIIFANDPRAWAATLARATVEPGEPLTEGDVAGVLEDVYVPRVRPVNPDLRQWFGETDAWWMDNLRRNIDRLDDEHRRAQALTLGLRTGDYALSFNEETGELRRPLTTIYWQLAGRFSAGPAGQPHNRCFNRSAEDFIKQARTDVLFLTLPSAHADRGGAEARSEWREAWVAGSPADAPAAAKHAPPQSRQAYLASVARLLRLASHFRTWAIECQESGLATLEDVRKLIKEYRPVRATYTKDVTEVAGGLVSHIIVGEKPSPR